MSFQGVPRREFVGVVEPTAAAFRIMEQVARAVQRTGSDRGPSPQLPLRPPRVISFNNSSPAAKPPMWANQATPPCVTCPAPREARP